MRTPTTLAFVSLAIAAAAPALAQPYKCAGPDGKIIFSDQRCETGQAAPKGTGTPEKSGRAMPSEDQERIKKLEALMVDPAANDEQKAAAQLEAGNIRRRLDARMPPGDRDRREALTMELANADPEARRESLRKLRELYRD